MSSIASPSQDPPGKPPRTLASAVQVAALIAKLPQEEVEYILEDQFWSLRFVNDVVAENPKAKALCWYNPEYCMAA